MPNYPANQNNNNDFDIRKLLTWGALSLFFFPSLTPFIAIIAAIQYGAHASKKKEQARLVEAERLQLAQQAERLAFERFIQRASTATLQETANFVQQYPQYAHWAIQNAPAYTAYVNRTMSDGVAELVQGAALSENWAQETLFAETTPTYTKITEVTGQAMPDAMQTDALARTLAEHFKQFQLLFKGRFRSPARKTTLEVYLAGYLCFFADLFTPHIYLGPTFARTFLHYINQSLTIQASNHKHFSDMFVSAYTSYGAVAEDLRSKLADPEAFISAYAQLFLTSLELSSVSEMLTLNTIEHTASILPIVEQALGMQHNTWQ